VSIVSSTSVHGSDDTPVTNIDGVTATVNVSTHTLRISAGGGKPYEIDGLRNYPANIEPAANEINGRFE
jgi:hypothetical protein